MSERVCACCGPEGSRDSGYLCEDCAQAWARRAVAGVAQSIRREELRQMVQALASGPAGFGVAPREIVDRGEELLAEIDRRCDGEKR